MISAEDNDPELALTRQAGTFTLELLPGDASRFDERRSLAIHETVLRPLLAWATQCWAYGVEPGSEVHASAGSLLTKAGRKHAVALDGDPILGHELFWNASGGKRGTIVILGPRDTFDHEALIRHASSVWTFGNFLSGHTPSAIRMARDTVKEQALVACCLPRNNGIQWIDIYSEPAHAVQMLLAARAALHWTP